MRSLAVQIPKPCHERWDEMQPAERGRFCAHCQKTVVDYSDLSDREIVRLLNNVTGETCGRFRNSQLDRYLPASNSKDTWRHWVGILTVSLFGWRSAQAQPNNSTQPHHVKLPSDRPTFAANSISIRKTIDPNAKRIVSGRVMLMDSSEHLAPVRGAKVTIFHGGEWQTESDGTGSFTIEIPVQTAKQINNSNPIQSNSTKIIVHVSTLDHLHSSLGMEVALSTDPIQLKDFILYQQRAVRDITGGGLTITRKPSLWQKLRRKLFH
ncbi:hypothetical protein [Spirosoma harenae]